MSLSLCISESLSGLLSVRTDYWSSVLDYLLEHLQANLNYLWNPILKQFPVAADRAFL